MGQGVYLAPTQGIYFGYCSDVAPHLVTHKATPEKRPIFIETAEEKKDMRWCSLGSSPGSLEWPGTLPVVLSLPITVGPQFSVNTMGQ